MLNIILQRRQELSLLKDTFVHVIGAQSHNRIQHMGSSYIPRQTVNCVSHCTLSLAFSLWKNVVPAKNAFCQETCRTRTLKVRLFHYCRQRVILLWTASVETKIGRERFSLDCSIAVHQRPKQDDQQRSPRSIACELLERARSRRFPAAHNGVCPFFQNMRHFLLVFFCIWKPRIVNCFNLGQGPWRWDVIGIRRGMLLATSSTSKA
mmetsp:Transcript_4193/g.8729  ORF Transcript_4193/g.8729 Transcript_4193/m.8729 type:complete len:207 (-) Transcript_4193:801-1421(-)